LPEAVIARAEEVLRTLESGEQSGAVTRLAQDLPLFAAAPAAVSRTPARKSATLAALANVTPDELTPKAALDLLYQLVALRREEEE
jgi:DNA mismatch repair protein MutS